MSYTILLIVCIAQVIFLTVLLPDADGGVRVEISQHKKTIDNLEDKASVLNKDVNAQKTLVAKNERLYETSKDEEKTARNNIGKSWTGVQEHNAALSKVESTKATWINSKDKLMTLYTQRSDVLKEIRVLEELIDELDAMPKTQDSSSTLIGFSIDNTCKAFIKNNLTSNCPTFELLDSFYPGSPCDYIDHSCIDYYKQVGGFHYLIDPPASVADRIKMIEIRYNFKEFHIQGDGGYDDINHTINYQVGRYLDGCKIAYIGSGDWLRYVGDTVYLLANNCDINYTYLGGFRSEPINQTEFDITDFKQWKLEQWIKESLERCKEKCFEY